MISPSIYLQDNDFTQSYGYKAGPKTAKEKAKEAVEALHEPDHWQRYCSFQVIIQSTNFIKEIFCQHEYPYYILNVYLTDF